MKRRLLVGVDAAPPAPLCFGLPGQPEFRGFEIDMLTALATRIGVWFEYTSALWSVILSDLLAGRIDLICTAATITDERRETVAFSQPYLESSLVLVTRSDRPAVDLANLGDVTIGVRKATVAERYVRTLESAVQVRTFDLNVHQYNGLRDRLVDLVVDDKPIAGYFARAIPGLALGPELPGTEFQYGIVVGRGNTALRATIDSGLDELRADGTLALLSKRWLT